MADDAPTPSDGYSDNDQAIETESMDHCRLLDSFPLNEAELERLLAIRDRVADVDCSLTSIMSRPDATSTFVESCILPELFLGEFFKTAVSTAFVVGAPPDQIEKWTYLEAMVTCLGRRGPRYLNDTVFSYCRSDDGNDTVRTEKALNLIYRIVLACHFLCVGLPESKVTVETPSSWVSSLSTERTSRRDFLEWISRAMPFMYNAASTMFHCILFSPHHSNFQPGAFSLPQLDAATLLWTHPWEPLPVSIACHSYSTGGQVNFTSTLFFLIVLRGSKTNVFLASQWRRLYSSNEDSFSFRAFANALIGYNGPTVILIKSTMGDTLGFYSNAVWKYSSCWYGGDADSFLFCSQPLGFFHPTGRGKTYQYLCLPSSHRERDLKGLAIGGISADCPRLHLTESLEHCRASAVDATYECGPLLSDDLESHFDVDILEAFAVNASESAYKNYRRSGDLQVAVREASRKQAAKVDRGQFLDDFVAGAFLNKGFEHREHSSGRLDFNRDGCQR